MDGHRVKNRATIVGEDGNATHIGAPWNIVAAGDFNLDGNADILWHNGQTGESQLWFMDGHRVKNRATIVGEDGNATHIGAPWNIVAAGDFNLDGNADILWHNGQTGESQLWFMDGHRVKNRATIVGEDGNPTHIGAPWNIVAAGDFNLDGNADILWHNANTGESQLWFMDGHRVKNRATIVGEDGNPTHIEPPWSVVGA